MSRANPENAEFRSDVAIGRRRVAEILFDLGDTPSAMRDALQSVAALEQIAAAGDAEMGSYLARSLGVLAKIQSATNPAAAIAAYRRAEGIHLTLSGADPSNALERSNLARSQVQLADLFIRLNRHLEAKHEYQRAVGN